jgi:tripartite-type tricarboxylate transporter receptor subunit TctC
MAWVRAAAAVLIVLSTPALAQTYPTHPITLIVPFPAGGPHDVVARPLAQWLGTRLGQNVIIDNRAGAGGTIGARLVARAAPDGYTLLFGSVSSLATGPALAPDPGYDATTSFAPIARVSQEALGIIAGQHVEAKTIGALIAWAKANPGKLNVGAPVGTQAHLAIDLFKQQTGTDVAFIPYKGGSPALTDVLAGQVDVVVLATSTSLPFIREGKLKALAVTSAQRIAQLPDTPTMVESGYPEMVADFWTGMLAPAGTPPELVARLNAEINQGIGASELGTLLANMSAAPMPGTPAEFGAFIAAEVPKWARVVKTSGATLQ